MNVCECILNSLAEIIARFYFYFFQNLKMSSSSYRLEVLDLSSCLLTHDMLQMLWPAFRHTHNLK